MPQVEFKTQFPTGGATVLDIQPRDNRFEHYFRHSLHLRPSVVSYVLSLTLPSLTSGPYIKGFLTTFLTSSLFILWPVPLIEALLLYPFPQEGDLEVWRNLIVTLTCG